VNAVGSGRKRNVGARVDEKARERSAMAIRVCFADDVDCITNKGLELTRQEIFFTELDVIDASFGGFRDLGQKHAA
jgi:hypothetical protein